MNGYGNFQQPERPFLPHNNVSNMMDMSGDGMNNFGMVDSQSLDDIVSQNEKANRRRSMPVYAGGPMQMGSPDSRRLSMMNFGDIGDTNYGDFQFSMPSDPSMESMMRSNTFPRSNANAPMEGMPTADLSVNTQYSNQNTTFSNLADPGSAYASPLPAGNSLDMEMNLASPYPPNAGMQFDMNDPSLNAMGTDMNLFPSNQFTGAMMDSPVAQDFSGPMPQTSQDNTMNGMSMGDQFGTTPVSTKSELPSGELSRPDSHEQSSQRSASRQQSEPQSAQGISHGPTASFGGGEPMNLPPTQDPSMETQSFNQNESFCPLKFPWTTPTEGFPSSRNNNTHMNTQFKNAYSSTGFDMLGVLMRVATRQNPDIDIGSVDLSCAFVVCDAQEHDIPIVYCSENFERLTGYTKHMILGRNCRFLQSPDGKVEPGIKRKYVDDDSVLYLKNMITARKEAQISLINYRRGGQPFMNLLTMIPIAWEPGQAIKFIVGFQVDLVEQPSAMTNKNSDGSYRVNYQRGLSMPSYVFNPDAPKMITEGGQTISKDEVSNVLATYGQTGDSEITRRLWDKVLLENTDDVVFVLSLKGLYLYLSPSSKRVLEYEASELVGTALSSVCHPSDIVPVTRELKESGNGASVNVVFRIRRKKSGYMWFEGHGSLHTEHGKGRKCIILVGRERPVYTLGKTIVRASGGIGDNELWSKMSTSGMFLFVSSNVRQLLDRQPEDLVGTSIQALMRQDSKQNFGRILELARGGRPGEVKHEMINKRGQVLQAFTTIYPGDATEGQKPTFVVGQTRLLKYSRSSQTQRPSIYQSKERNSGDSTTSSSMIPGASPIPAQSLTGNTGSNTPLTVASDGRFMTTDAQPTTFAGQQGLAIGHQDQSLASEENIFDELKTTRSTSWQYELRQMEKRNRYLAEEVQSLLAAKKKRKRRKGAGQMQKDCANCHTRTTPEWRRGPSGNRDLCNSCGLRWAKQNGRVSPRASSQSDKSKKSASPRHNQSILPNVIPETGTQSSIPSSMVQPGKSSPQQAGDNTYTAKAVRKEADASQGYGHSSAHSTHMQPPNIPSQIDEGTEPT